MSVHAISWAKKQRTGNATLKHVLRTIADHANDRGEVCISTQRIASETELPLSEVTSALLKLEELRMLARDGLGRTVLPMGEDLT